jgi:hypothetical protein
MLLFPWRACIDASLFAAEVQTVIALRMMRLAAGGSEAAEEARCMVAEKPRESHRDAAAG